MPSQKPRAPDISNFPHRLKSMAQREIGGAEGSGEEEGDNFKSNLFCNRSKSSSKREKKSHFPPIYSI